jgi:acetyltransferase
MFNYAIGFAFQPVPRGNRVAIVTNAGGPGIMATDACVRAGLTMAEISPDIKEALKKVLPVTASVANPIDVIGDAHFDRYEKTFQILAKDSNVDAVFVILTPQAMTDIEDTAKAVVKFDNETSLPVVASFMGGPVVEGGVNILVENEIPHYAFPEEAAKALATMYDFRVWMSRPRTEVGKFEVDRVTAKRVIAEAKQNGQKALLIHQAMQVFKAYGIPVPAFAVVGSRAEAVEKAKQIGYPIVLKVVSQQVIHKIDVGGVRLNLASEQEVAEAYDQMTQKIAATGAKIEGVLVQAMAKKGREVILGMNRDPQFGPVIMFGLGGIYVEAIKDVSFRLAPIRELSARHMIEQIRTYSILKGIRGEKPADLDAIVECLLRLSQLACDQTDIREMDINPLLVFSEGQGASALDARIIL